MSSPPALAPDNVAARAGPDMHRVMLVANTGWNILRFRRPLIETLVAAGIEVTVVADFAPADLVAARRLGAQPIAVPLDAAGLDPRADFRYALHIARLMRLHRPDLAHFFTLKPIVYGIPAARLAGTRAIVAAVTGSGVLRTQARPWLRTLLALLLRQALCGRTHAIFQNQDDLATFTARRLIAAARTHLIAGSGVDMADLQPEAGILPGERTNFVMASRMLWSKGVADYVAAARIVRLRHPHAQFVLFGGNREDYGSKNPDFIDRAWLEALNYEGIVLWRGWTAPEEVEATMRRAAAVVLPSTYGEGVPRSLIEAAAAGTPIITTDMPGCRDTVVPEVSGFVCPPNAPDALAKAMSALLDQPERINAMGFEGRSLALARFEQTHIVGHTLKVYSAALAGQTHEIRTINAQGVVNGEK
jgi:glycosyltransferase involved in cell wall biosynthesis